MNLIKFETTVENGVIIIPAELKEYLNKFSEKYSGVEITVAEINETETKIINGKYSGPGEIPPGYFNDNGPKFPKDFKFNREEANERR